MPGVGTVLACTLIAPLPELGQISRTQVAALVGVAPYDFDSGKFKGVGIILTRPRTVPVSRLSKTIPLHRVSRPKQLGASRLIQGKYAECCRSSPVKSLVVRRTRKATSTCDWMVRRATIYRRSGSA
jgi:transposase